MNKVLMCGNHSSNKGGMTSVINQILEYDWKKEDIKLKFVPTFIPGNAFVKSLFFFFSYIRIFLIILCDKPNLVHMHMSYKGSFTRKYMIHRLCKIFGVNDAVHLHGSEFKNWYDTVGKQKKAKIRRLLSESDYFIVLGEKWNKIIKEIEPETNTIVVSNSVHIPKETVKWNDPFKILYVGVLIKRKGVSDLLKATKLLKDDFGRNKFEVIIAGSGPEEENLKYESKELNIEDVVNFVGWTDGEKKMKLLQECQMLVLPSYNEGLPIAILEAMSYGMPIVATNVGDISSAVIDEVNGYLVEPGNFRSMAESILKLSKDNTRFISFSQKSKEITINKFSDHIFFENVKNIYWQIGGVYEAIK